MVNLFQGKTYSRRPELNSLANGRTNKAKINDFIEKYKSLIFKTLKKR